MPAQWLEPPSTIGLPGPWNGANLLVYVGPWSGLPAAGSVPPESKAVVTDVGIGTYSEWYTDGTYWRPVNNFVCLYQRMGSLAAPLATLVAPAATTRFAIPAGYTLPAGILFPGSTLCLNALIRRVGSAGTSATLTVGISTVDSLSTSISPAIGYDTIAVVANRDKWFYAEMQISAPTVGSLTGNLSPGGATTGALADVALVTGVPYYAGVASSAFTLDTMALLGFSVSLRG